MQPPFLFGAPSAHQGPIPMPPRMAAASARLVGQQTRRQAEKDPARLVLPSIFTTVTDDAPELAGEQRSELEVDAARYKEPASVLAGLPLSAEQAETIRRMLQPFAADRGAGLTGDMSGGLWRTLRNMGLSTNLTGEIMRRASALSPQRLILTHLPGSRSL